VVSIAVSAVGSADGRICSFQDISLTIGDGIPSTVIVGENGSSTGCLGVGVDTITSAGPGSITAVTINPSGFSGAIAQGFGKALKSPTVSADPALSRTSLVVDADAALLATSGVNADTALLVTSTVTAHDALGVTSVEAKLALEVTTSVTADVAEGVTSSDGELLTSVGADGALGVTSVVAKLALGLTGGLIGLSGLKDDVVTGEGHTLFSNLEGTDDGVDDLLGGSGLDTEDLHVAIGTILGEVDEVLLGDFSGRKIGESGPNLVDVGGNSVTFGVDEET